MAGYREYRCQEGNEGGPQVGQEKYGMQTMNQSLANLYQRRLITLEDAMPGLRTRIALPREDQVA